MQSATACLVSALLLVGCGGQSENTEPAQIGANQGAVRIGATIVRNGEIVEGLPIRFDPADLPRLQQLRQRESLAPMINKPRAVLGGPRTEFESILLIKDWVAAQWPHSLPDPYPPWDAITILDWIREGRTGGFCGQYSQVMLQSLAAFGIQARYLEIGAIDSPFAHFVIEVWSNDFDKWVVMDVDFNIHFERNGIPLGGLELHDALLRDGTSDIVTVLGSVREGHDYPDRFPLNTIELYYYLRLMLKADHLSVTEEPAFDRLNDMVEWNDEVTVPWEQSTVESEYWHSRLTLQTTRDRDVFNAKLNQTVISVDEDAQAEVAGDSLVDDQDAINPVLLRLSTNHQRFFAYELREVNTRNGRIRRSWDEYVGSSFWWKPTKGYRLEVRAVDSSFRPGPPAIVEAEIVQN